MCKLSDENIQVGQYPLMYQKGSKHQNTLCAPLSLETYNSYLLNQTVSAFLGNEKKTTYNDIVHHNKSLSLCHCHYTDCYPVVHCLLTCHLLMVQMADRLWFCWWCRTYHIQSSCSILSRHQI